jgi:hypothetical protein
MSSMRRYGMYRNMVDLQTRGKIADSDAVRGVTVGDNDDLSDSISVLLLGT